MRKVLASDIRRGIFNTGWCLSVIVLTFLLYRPLKGCFGYKGTVHVLELATYPMALSGFTLFAAVFPVMGYSCSFYQDFTSGYLYDILSRMSLKKYGWMRILSAGISGGLSIAVPFTVIFTVCYMVGKKGSLDGRLYDGTNVGLFVEKYGTVCTLAAKVVLGFLFGMMWALVGIALSMFIVNKYVALIGPFIFYQFMWIVLYKVPVLNPIFLVRGDDLDSYGLSGSILVLYILCLCALIMDKLKRRVRNG